VTSEIPVIFLTAKNETADIVKGFELGAVDYVTKPFRPQELFARIKTHFQLTALQKQTLQQNAQLVELNAMKNEFLGVAVHDLKNPLSGITGLAEYLRDTPDIEPETANQCLDTIIAQSTKMFAIITNLLNVNAIERGALSLNLQPTNIGALAQATMESYLLKAEAKSITLSSRINASGARSGDADGSGESACVAIADEVPVIQILDNLISNALKFSPSGKSVQVSVSNEANAQGGSQGGASVVIAVRDEGPGISSEDQAKLFTTFTKLTAQPTAGEHSTGLGLSIVKRLVEAMNGSVACESTLGQGTTFIVRLPAAV
jgi:two-component system, sensor histidine kinase and response regulator